MILPRVSLFLSLISCFSYLFAFITASSYEQNSSATLLQPYDEDIACNGSCSFCMTEDGSTSNFRVKRDVKENCSEWKETGRITLELAIFADHALYKDYHQRYPQNSTLAKLKLQEYIFSIVQQGKELFLSPTLEPNAHIEIVEYKLIRHRLRPHHIEKKVHLDMPTYMESFCRYQEKIKRWDHAVLFTGLDLVHINQQGNFAGYSSSNSVCGPLSCSIIEAASFKSAYTFAHEIGHSLGMGHDDGSEDCPKTCCVMTPVVFSGSSNWSRCSVKQLQEYLESIPCTLYCLNDRKGDAKSAKTIPPPANLPGQTFTAFDQCRHGFGPCSQPSIFDPEDICKELWCTDQGGGSRLAHAALEGTYCGDGKWCRLGQCVAADQRLDKRDGQWSPWTTDGASCGHSACSEKDIIGQLSVQRQLRTCSDPSPNNGGLDCQGEAYRGVVCQEDTADGSTTPGPIGNSTGLQTAEEFATKLCTEHRRIAEERMDTFITLSGDGFQRKGDNNEPNACYVWCTVVNATFTSYTFFDQFPDGTQCGRDGYCLSAKCVSRKTCNSTFSVLSENAIDCEIASTVTSTSATTTAPRSSSVAPAGGAVFSQWSSWSGCSRTCGVGVKRRVRHCAPAADPVCAKLSNKRQFQYCRSKTPCPPPATTISYSEVKMNDTEPPIRYMEEKEMESNGLPGVNRERGHSGRGYWEERALERHPTRRTKLDAIGQRTQWSNWTDCRPNCAGYQKSFRTCLPPSASCRGPLMKKRRCKYAPECKRQS